MALVEKMQSMKTLKGLAKKKEKLGVGVLGESWEVLGGPGPSRCTEGGKARGEMGLRPTSTLGFPYLLSMPWEAGLSLLILYSVQEVVKKEKSPTQGTAKKEDTTKPGKGSKCRYPLAVTFPAWRRGKQCRGSWPRCVRQELVLLMPFSGPYFLLTVMMWKART